MLAFASALQDSLVNEVGEVAGCGRGRGLCDGHVVPCTEPSLESLRAFPEHSHEDLPLAVVELTSETI